MSKRELETDVLKEAVRRLEWTFETFERVYLSFSAGKDSTVMLHLAIDVARRMQKRFGVLLIDLEAQYGYTMEHAEAMIAECRDVADPYWVALPLHLRNAVSQYQPFWMCWDPDAKESWVRNPPKIAITDESHFPFFRRGMEFEEFVPMFGEWYAEGKSCACLVGIRSDESLNRWRTITSKTKVRHSDKCYTTRLSDDLYNVYPIYDWRTEDIWTYHGRNPDKRSNKLYDVMYQAGLTVAQMRICQPYGDDQRRGLWLFHLIEPQTWSKVVARVNGANGGALYIQESGNINGYRKIAKPKGHTWESYTKLLLSSLPPETSKHYAIKFRKFIEWWMLRGYEGGIPDEAPLELEAEKIAPSWRRMCKCVLRNDFWCKGLSFTQQKSHAYSAYIEMRKRKDRESQNAFFVD